jgi:hypothetical protein
LRQSRTDLLALAPPSAAVVAARRTRSGLEVCDRQIKYEGYPELGLESLQIMIGTNSFTILPQEFLTAHTSSRPRDRRRRLGVLSARRGVPRDDARRAGARALPPPRSLRRPCP